MSTVLVPVGVGFAFGALTRCLLLQVDYRQYPSYPHGYVTHLALGLIASLSGAAVVPALHAGEFTAATFLLLVATQFREVRDMERKTLAALESASLVPRGPEYIEGIARTFEARNYLTIAVAAAVAALVVYGGLPAGVSAGVILAAGARLLKTGRHVGDIATVEEAPVSFDGPNVYVAGVYMMNVGPVELREALRRWAVGVRLRPRGPDGVNALASIGQRQAILHDVTALFGTRKDVAVPELTPLARRDQETGDVALLLAPMVRDLAGICAAVRGVPVLESSRSAVYQSAAARAALRRRRGGSAWNR
ncbi:MAG: YIEGIA domain-containing protein [Clostridia bacterium]|nr:YIEGIA domain-containing protein [Clostridia bacterium]